jgi:outer membrane protein OmpA-like peptidoglycan-associated protein
MKLSRILLIAVLLAGCGSTPPPRELMDARDAYEKAKGGQAQQLRPDQVHEAKVALDQAEAAYNDDPKADKTRDLSYVALRKAELSMAEAGVAAAKAQQDQAAKELLTLQQQGLTKMQGELSKTKEQLAVTGEKLTAAGQALETEKKARLEAEKRARDAMDKLAVAAALAVKEEPRGTVIVLPGNVLFASGKWVLLPEAQKKLDAVAEALKNQEDHKMLVEGHTDSQGKESDNLELGGKRAQAVRDYLVSRGVPADKISSVGIGQSRPISDNKSPEGRAQNRRVEIIVQPHEKR